MRVFQGDRALRLHPSKIISVMLILFLLYFPKGGVKIVGIPVTWGYLLLFVSVLATCFRRTLKLSSLHFISLLSVIPFVIVGSMTMILNGVESLGFSFSFLVSFAFLPLVMMGIFPRYFDKVTEENLLFWIKKGVFFIALYGLFLFFYKILTKKFFEIPLLTINFHDRNSLEDLKCIDRGGFFKLISTYNNGNIYGICLLMFFPLFLFLEKNFLKRSVVRLSLLFTISRTVWLGWIFAEALVLLFLKRGILRFVQIIMMLSLIGCSLFLFALYFSLDSTFFFDEYLGNRLGQFEVLKDLHFFSRAPFDYIYEVIYLGVLRSFGVIGLLTFLLGMLTPVLLFLFKRQTYCSKDIDRAALLGVITYLFIGFADGAILYIPVMCFYWFLCSFLLADRTSELIRLEQQYNIDLFQMTP